MALTTKEEGKGVKLDGEGVSTCEWPFPLRSKDFVILRLWVSLKDLKPDEDRRDQSSIWEG